MKSPFSSRLGALAAALAGLVTLPGVGLAEDTTPPVVVKPLVNLTVPAGTTTSVINLKKTFGLTGVKGTLVRMATVLGNIDIELLDTETPKNVANFLTYVNNGNYNKSFIHRSVPGFVIQGGGYYVDSSDQVDPIPMNAPVVGEHVRSNTRGTLALALSTGPNSGTNEWFFNLKDNNSGQENLDDTSDGGPFTVFGRVIEGDMATVDAIAALPVYDFTSSLGGAFNMLPLYNYDASGSASVDNLVYVNDAVVIPTVAPSVGADSVLTLKAKSNNTALVTAMVSGKKLKLSYVSGQTGTAKIKVLAKDSAGTQTKSQFTVTVQ